MFIIIKDSLELGDKEGKRGENAAREFREQRRRDKIPRSSIHKDLKLKEAREEELKVPQYRALEKVTFCTIPPFYTITMTVIRKAYLP